MLDNGASVLCQLFCQYKLLQCSVFEALAGPTEIDGLEQVKVLRGSPIAVT